MNKRIVCAIVLGTFLSLLPSKSIAGWVTYSASQQQGLQNIAAMMEISWVVGNVNYTGLLVVKNDARGVFVVRFMHPGLGIIRVRQNALVNNQYDMFGNCTSFIICSDPSDGNYSPDRFIINPNGSMFTADSQGNWSMMIMATTIMPNFWLNKLQEYELDANLHDERAIKRSTPKYATL